MTDRAFYQRRTVAVTGSAGYIGAALAEALADAGAHVLRVSRRPQPARAGTEVLQADVGTMECWGQILPRADVVFHLAGNTSLAAAAADPGASLRSTVAPITALTETAARMDCHPRVVFASTVTVYGITNRHQVSEDVEPNPVTTYDRHKVLAEQLLERATGDGAVDGVSLRLANVYGSSPGAGESADRHVLNRIAWAAVGGEDIPLYEGARFVRDYVHLDDVVKAFTVAGAARAVHGPLNVGTGRGVTVRDAFALVVEAALERGCRTGQLHDAAWPREPDTIERRHFVADITRIGAALGWRPSISLETGIGRMVAGLAGVRVHG